jgi:hypothetical protein
MSKLFSSDYYDAANQHAAWSASGDRERQRRALKSRLRFDFLFSGNITLSRADVLDGATFMLTTPQEICNWLALDDVVTSPITIMTKTGALDADLIDWVRRPGMNALRAEPFLVVPQTLTSEYAAEFGRLPSITVNNWKDLPKAIAAVIGKEDVASELMDYWGNWIEQAPKSFNIVQFPRSVDYEKHIPKKLDPDILPVYGLTRDSSEAQDATYLYATAVNVFSINGWQRGPLEDWLDKNVPKDTSVSVAVRDQINIGICRARAHANNTNHETFSQAALSEPSLGQFALRLLTDDPISGRPMEPIDIGIPQHLAEWLPDCDYKELIRNVRIARQNWLRTNNVESLKKFADLIANIISNDPGPLRYESSPFVVNIVRVAAMTGAAIAAVHWDLIPGQGWYDAFKIVSTAVAGQWVASKERLDWVAGKLYKKQIVNQVLQSVRRRDPVTNKRQRK